MSAKLDYTEKLVGCMANFLCTTENGTVDFLEKVAIAKDQVNELTGMAPSHEIWEQLSKAYDVLDKLLSPICPDCQVRAERFITSDAQLYDPAMAELPGGTTTYWTGTWYCPKCRHTVAVGKRWWKTPKKEGD